MADDFPSLELLKAGDEDAWTQAFDCLWFIAKSAAEKSHTALTDEEVKDVAMQALTAIVKGIAQIRDSHHLVARTVVVARNEAIQLARKNSAEKRGRSITVHADAPTTEGGEAKFEAVDPTDPYAESELNEVTEILREVFSKLDQLERELLVGNAFGGLTHEELSQKHQMPKGTVASKLARAYTKLRAILEKHPKQMQVVRDFLRLGNV